MSLMDKTGRNLRKGQLVDVFLMGRFTGEVVAIEEGSVVQINGPKRPPVVVVSIGVPFGVQGNTCPYVYIVKSAPPGEDHDDLADMTAEMEQP